MSFVNRRLGLAALAIGTWACTAEPEIELPPLTHHGAYVSMGIGGAAEPCAGTLPWMDHHVETLGLLFARDIQDIALEYYWLDSSLVYELCGPDAYACTRPLSGVVYSAGSLVEHEIVHAVIDGWVGSGDRFFDEGLAVALGDHLLEPYVRDEFAEIPAMIGSDRMVEIDYPSAGAFVNDLIEIHGPVAMLEFYDETTTDDTYAVVADVFEANFGLALEAAHDAFLARGRGCGMSLPACSMPAAPWTGDVWSVDATVSCSTDGLGPDAGPDNGSGKPWNFVSLDIPTPGSYVLEFDGPPYPLFAQQCGPCATRVTSVGFGVPGEAPAVELPAGRFVVWLPGHEAYDCVYPLLVRPTP